MHQTAPLVCIQGRRIDAERKGQGNTGGGWGGRGETGCNIGAKSADIEPVDDQVAAATADTDTDTDADTDADTDTDTDTDTDALALALALALASTSARAGSGRRERGRAH